MMFSILASLALIISICIKDRKKSLNIQALNCLFEAIYAFTIQAFTGAILSLISYIRTHIFIQSEKINKKIYFFILVFFESIIIANCIYTWNGIISILPTIGSIIRTFCLWQNDMRLVRFSGITTGIFYGLYYLYYESWFIVFGDILLIMTGIVSIYENDLKNHKNKVLVN